MTLTGRLSVHANWHAGRCTALHIANERPRVAALLVGRSVAEALAAVPLLFSICARAQYAAARAACDAARGETPLASELALRAQRVSLEAAGEHLRHLLLDWPVLLGLEPHRALLARWLRHAETLMAQDKPRLWQEAGLALQALIEDELLPLTPRQWAALTEPEALLQVRGRGAFAPLLHYLIQAAPEPFDATSAAHPPLLPAVSARELDSELSSHAEFAARPTWRGQPAETGALAWAAEQAPVRAAMLDRPRQPAHGRVLARVLARIDALYQCARLMQQFDCANTLIDACASAPDQGFARVHSARGLLTHRVQLSGERITAWQVIAPTEWNFHPEGALRALLRPGYANAEALEAQLREAILSLDPCVAWDVAIRKDVDAGDGAHA